MNTKKRSEQLSASQETVVRLALVQMYISRQDDKESRLKISGATDGRTAATLVNYDNDLNDLADAYQILFSCDINASAAMIRKLTRPQDESGQKQDLNGKVAE